MTSDSPGPSTCLSQAPTVTASCLCLGAEVLSLCAAQKLTLVAKREWRANSFKQRPMDWAMSLWGH